MSTFDPKKYQTNPAHNPGPVLSRGTQPLRAGYAAPQAAPAYDMRIAVERGVPLAVVYRGGGIGNKLPFHQLEEQGMSFFIDTKGMDEAEAARLLTNVHGASYYNAKIQQKVGQNIRYMVRKVEGGIRVWRLT